MPTITFGELKKTFRSSSDTLKEIFEKENSKTKDLSTKKEGTETKKRTWVKGTVSAKKRNEKVVIGRHGSKKAETEAKENTTAAKERPWVKGTVSAKKRNENMTMGGHRSKKEETETKENTTAAKEKSWVKGTATTQKRNEKVVIGEHRDKKAKAKNLLRTIKKNNIYFCGFPSNQDFNFTHCCNYLYRGKPETSINKSKVEGDPYTAKKLSNVLNSMLDKGDFISDNSYEYLLGVDVACDNFFNVFASNMNNNSDPSNGIKVYEEVNEAFKAICEFFEKNNYQSTSSFLNDEDFKNYLKEQSKIIEDSLNNLRAASKRK